VTFQITISATVKGATRVLVSHFTGPIPTTLSARFTTPASASKIHKKSSPTLTHDTT